MIVEQFTRLYFATSVYYWPKWMEIPTLHDPCDMKSVQAIICEVKPDFIIETGTCKDGGALFFASFFRSVNQKGKVLTMDIKPQVEDASKYPIFQGMVEVYTGSSVDKDIVDRISRRVAEARVIITLDFDHHKVHVAKELGIYLKLVSSNSYLIVQDTAHHGHSLPVEALRDFLKSHKNFVVDRGREKFRLRFFPSKLSQENCLSREFADDPATESTSRRRGAAGVLDRGLI